MTSRLAAALALVLMVAGCGSRDEAQQASTPSPSETAVVADGAPRITNSADGVHIQYRVYGQSAEPALVLIHGWSCDSNYWSAQVNDLKNRYTVVTVDLAGHGASGRNRSDWSMERFGEDVAAVVRELPNRQVVLVGHSMGGPVALQAAARIGDRVIGVIGVDTFKTIGLPAMPPQQLEKQLEPFRTDFIGHTRQWVAESFFAKDADPQLIRKVADDMALAPPDVAVASIQALFKMDFDEVLSHIKVPIIAINSDLGQPTDETRIRKRAPTFRAVVMKGTGHFLMMEKPQEFNAVLVQEIAALTGDASAPSL